MRILKAFSLLMVVSVSGCVDPQVASYSTPSGRPEVVFSGSNLKTVSAKLAALCADRGILVKEVTETKVVCGGTMSGGDAALAQLVVGNSYSTTPERYVQFTLFPYQGGTRVQAQQWIESQMAFGQVNRQELNSGAQFNNILDALIGIGGNPVGTKNAAEAG